MKLVENVFNAIIIMYLGFKINILIKVPMECFTQNSIICTLKF